MMGMLASLGIEPDKPFNPPPNLKAAMERGVIDAYYYMQSLDTKLHASSLYWPDRHWSFVMVPDAKHGRASGVRLNLLQASAERMRSTR